MHYNAMAQAPWRRLSSLAFIGSVIREPSLLRKEGSLWKVKHCSFSFWKETKTLGSIQLYLHVIRKARRSSRPFMHEPGVELDNHMWTSNRGLQGVDWGQMPTLVWMGRPLGEYLTDPLSRNRRTCMLNRNHGGILYGHTPSLKPNGPISPAALV